jgi:hypothetical protein
MWLYKIIKIKIKCLPNRDGSEAFAYLVVALPGDVHPALARHHRMGRTSLRFGESNCTPDLAVVHAPMVIHVVGLIMHETGNYRPLM